MRSLFGRLRGCDRCLGSWRECDLSFSVSSVSLWFVKKGCLGLEGMRSLFGGLKGCDRCLGVEGCDSEARPRNRCLGSWRGAIAVWEVGGMR